MACASSGGLSGWGAPRTSASETYGPISRVPRLMAATTCRPTRSSSSSSAYWPTDVRSPRWPRSMRSTRLGFRVPSARGAASTRATRRSTLENFPAVICCFCGAVRSIIGPASPRAKPRQEAEQLEVEPHQRDEQPERGEPLQRLGRACRDGTLAEVEVEQQVRRGDADDEKAEDDPEQPGVVDERNVSTKEPQHRREQVDREDRDGGRDDHRPHLVGDADA